MTEQQKATLVDAVITATVNAAQNVTDLNDLEQFKDLLSDLIDKLSEC